jgi:lipoprotein-releasing system permease protein
VIRLALAYILRRPVQLLAIIGIAVGITALLVVLSVMNGLIDMNRQATKSTQADLHLTPVVSSEVQSFSAYQQALQNVESINAVAPRLIVYAMFSSPGYYTDYSNSQTANHNGIQIIGIDFELETKVSDFQNLLASSKILQAQDKDDCFAASGIFSRPGIIVSDSFYRTLPPAVNQSISSSEYQQLELASLPSTLPPINEELIPHNATANITATYAASNYRSALNAVFMARTGINGLRYNLLGSEAPEFTEIVIDLKPDVDVAAAKQQIVKALNSADISTSTQGGFTLETWQQRSATILAAIDNERRMVAIILMFIVLVATFGLFASLSALVREKTRDLGVLAALGYSPLSRANLLMLTGTVASIIGCTLGWLGAKSFFIYRTQIVDFLRDQLGMQIFSPDLYIVQGVPALWIDGQVNTFMTFSFLICIILTAIPAFRAARLSPVNALRQN